MKPSLKSVASAPGLELPCATIKARPEDWRVNESLGWAFTKSGEHRYLYIEKRNMNTAAVAAELVRRYSVRPQDVGYAGLKDKCAITRQWFSVTTADDSIEEEFKPPEIATADRYFRCLKSDRHQRKLRRGEHQRNDFTIRLGCDLALALPLMGSLAQPFANYFGPQRFGRDNLAAAKRWLVDRQPRRVSKAGKGLYLSVARSHLFNLILAARERQDCVATAVAGDISGSVVGSLWGRGRSPFTDQALAIENAAVHAEHALCHGLEMAGVNRGLRPLLVEPVNFSFAQHPAEAILELSFSLPPGAYATVMLQRCFELKDQSR